MNKDDIIEGVKCERCYPRRFGQMVNDEDDNLYLYVDLSGHTRCFCKLHMIYFDTMGAMKNYEQSLLDKSVVPGYGAVLKSKILEMKQCCRGVL
jgi:hypothetical protein